jgi:hypothetical protein
VQEKQEHQRTLPGGAYRMDQQAFPKNNFAAIPEEYLEIPESKIVLDDREFGKY